MAETKAKQEGKIEEEEEYCDPEFLKLYEHWIAKAKEEASKPSGAQPRYKRIVKGVDEWEYYQGELKHRVGAPAVISPNYIEYYQNNVYHRDQGPSCVYRDGDKLWHLNGVQMPEEIVMANDFDFNKEWFFKTDNVEVRREVLRKFGVERVMKDLKAKVIDKQGEYELLMIELGGDVLPCPALKMKNPSEGTWHVEWVDRRCRTVKEALEFRNGSNMTPRKLT